MAGKTPQRLSPPRAFVHFARKIVSGRDHSVTEAISLRQGRQGSIHSLPCPSKRVGSVKMNGMGKVSSSPSVVTIQVDPADADKRDNQIEQDTSTNLMKSDLKEYKEAFRLFDQDGLGYITCGQLRRVMFTLGMDPSAEDVHYMVTAADENRTGVIEFEEFVDMMERYNQLYNGEQAQDEMFKAVFKVFDTTNDGYISILEIQAVMKTLGERISDEELQGMLSAADTSGDGIITFEEFRSICTGDASSVTNNRSCSR